MPSQPVNMSVYNFEHRASFCISKLLISFELLKDKFNYLNFWWDLLKILAKISPFKLGKVDNPRY